jgi:hypothetical protein
MKSRHWGIVLTLLSVTLGVSAGAATAERRVALIIGNSTYKNVVALPPQVSALLAIELGLSDTPCCS